MFVGLHRAIEGEEVLILVKGIREDLIASCIALTSDLFSFRCRLRDQHGDFAIRPGADFLSTLCALGAEFRGLALAFGLHALINGLAILLREVGASDTHVHHLYAIRASFAVNQFTDARHEVGALVAHDVRERYLTEYPAQCGIEE